MTEASEFEARKADHIRLALESQNEATGGAGFDSVTLTHEALPDLNFSDISLNTNSLQTECRTPFFVSSMTAGHTRGVELNLRLAKACAAQGWWMAVGSQRRELFDANGASEWKSLRAAAPKATLLGNLGLTQVVQSKVEDIQRLVDSLEAKAMIVHLNPLQEVIQPEGTPNFRNGFLVLAELVRLLPVPVIVKETGCGISLETAQRLSEIGVAVIDVAGFGGTHWGRIEGQRAAADSMNARAAETFRNWGLSTVQCLNALSETSIRAEVWASGGIRSGLDAAKAIALGATRVGFAKPALEAALRGESDLVEWMKTCEYELKVALFCTGSLNVSQLTRQKIWKYQPC